MNPCLRSLTLCFSLTLFPLSSPGQGQLVQWTTNSGGNGHFYEAVFAPSGITWASAQALAVGRGGYLATITSAAENNFVYGLISGDLSYWHVTGTEAWGPWLGGLQPVGSAEPAGGWTWITGEAFSYQNWAALQPNNNQNENRIQFHGHNAPGGAPTWNDLNDSNIQYVRGYIIEYTVLPALAIVLSGGQVELTWTTNSAGYTLQCATNLVSPAVWSTVSPGPVVVNGQNAVTNPISGTKKFYRLSP
jgi:hypothetical protein